MAFKLCYDTFRVRINGVYYHAREVPVDIHNSLSEEWKLDLLFFQMHLSMHEMKETEKLVSKKRLSDSPFWQSRASRRRGRRKTLNLRFRVLDFLFIIKYTYQWMNLFLSHLYWFFCSHFSVCHISLTIVLNFALFWCCHLCYWILYQCTIFFVFTCSDKLSIL